nr:hypothetical protein [Rhodovibrio sodomensis]
MAHIDPLFPDPPLALYPYPDLRIVYPRSFDPAARLTNIGGLPADPRQLVARQIDRNVALAFGSELRKILGLGSGLAPASDRTTVVQKVPQRLVEPARNVDQVNPGCSFSQAFRRFHLRQQRGQFAVKGEATLEGVKLLVALDALVPEPTARASPLWKRFFLSLVWVDAENCRLPDDRRLLRVLRQRREFSDDLQMAPARGVIRFRQPHATSSRSPSGPASRPPSA